MNISVYKIHIRELLGAGEFECEARANDVAIWCSTSDGYRKAAHYLPTGNINFHTFQPKEEKSFGSVIRYLHRSPPDIVKEDLRFSGFEM